jgi:hypothetical protein
MAIVSKKMPFTTCFQILMARAAEFCHQKLILVDQTGKSAGRDDIMKAPIKAKEVRFG